MEKNIYLIEKPFFVSRENYVQLLIKRTSLLLSIQWEPWTRQLIVICSVPPTDFPMNSIVFLKAFRFTVTKRSTKSLSETQIIVVNYLEGKVSLWVANFQKMICMNDKTSGKRNLNKSKIVCFQK